MAFAPVPKSCLAQMTPLSLDECKLHFIPPCSTCLFKESPLHLPYTLRNIHTLEGRVVAYALKERDTISCTCSSLGAQNPVSRARTHAMGERFEPLADGNYESTMDGRAVDPLAG